MGSGGNLFNTGDWLSHFSGNNLEINITAGLPIETITHGTVFLLYLSLGMVTDELGNVQFYYTTLDQEYIPGGGGFVSDTGGDGAYGLGNGITRGVIWGEEFSTDKFLGKGYAWTIPAGPLPATVGFFGPQDQKLNYKGFEYGPSAGFSMGDVKTNTKGMFSIQMPKSIIPVCQALGQCGTLFSIP